MKWTACALLSLSVCGSISAAQSQRAQTMDTREIPQRQTTPDFVLDMTNWSAVPSPPARPVNPSGARVSVDELKIPALARKEWARFQQSFKAGNLQDSVKHLNKTVQIYPQLAAAHQSLGACYVRLNEYEEAVSEFRTAAEMEKQAIQPVLGLAGAYLALHRYGDAETASRHALEIDPGNSMGRYLLGNALALEGRDTPEAEQLLRESSAQYPGAHLVLAHIMLSRNDKEEAAEQLREYVQHAETTPKAKEKFNCVIEKLTMAASELACDLNPGMTVATD
jgi:tetratricopeptide (TPR) repeat protein